MVISEGLTQIEESLTPCSNLLKYLCVFVDLGGSKVWSGQARCNLQQFYKSNIRATNSISIDILREYYE